MRRPSENLCVDLARATRNREMGRAAFPRLRGSVESATHSVSAGRDLPFLVKGDDLAAEIRLMANPENNLEDVAREASGRGAF